MAPDRPTAGLNGSILNTSALSNIDDADRALIRYSGGATQDCRTAAASKLDAQMPVSPSKSQIRRKNAPAARRRRAGEMGKPIIVIRASKLDASSGLLTIAHAARSLALVPGWPNLLSSVLTNKAFNISCDRRALLTAALPPLGKPWRRSRPGSMAPIRSYLVARDLHA